MGAQQRAAQHRLTSGRRSGCPSRTPRGRPQAALKPGAAWAAEVHFMPRPALGTPSAASFAGNLVELAVGGSAHNPTIPHPRHPWPKPSHAIPRALTQLLVQLCGTERPGAAGRLAPGSEQEPQRILATVSRTHQTTTQSPAAPPNTQGTAHGTKPPGCRWP